MNDCLVKSGKGWEEMNRRAEGTYIWAHSVQRIYHMKQAIVAQSIETSSTRRWRGATIRFWNRDIVKFKRDNKKFS